MGTIKQSKAGALGGNKRIWTKEECKKIADKFKTVKELMNSEKYNPVYQAISKNKWQEELFKNLKHKTYWNEEKCKIEANKYNRRSHFMRKVGGAYNYAKRHNFLDKICKHMK